MQPVTACSLRNCCNRYIVLCSYDWAGEDLHMHSLNTLTRQTLVASCQAIFRPISCESG